MADSKDRIVAVTTPLTPGHVVVARGPYDVEAVSPDSAGLVKLNDKGEVATPSVLAQIDARTKATMRADLPALAKELKIGGVDGSIPIFPTLAEAQAWEKANPGKMALTVEPSTPDTTAPTWAATLTVGAVADGEASVTASALATDDRGIARYEVTTNGTAWATTTPVGKVFTVTGLTGGRTYTGIKLRAVDAAGNTSPALTVPNVVVPLSAPKDYAYQWVASDATPTTWVDRKAGASLTKEGTGEITLDGTMVAFPKPASGTQTRTIARYKRAGLALTTSPTFTVVARAYQPANFKFQMLLGTQAEYVTLPSGAGSASIANVAGAPVRADGWQVYTFRYPAPGSTTGYVTSGTATASQTTPDKNWGSVFTTSFGVGSPHADAGYAFLGDIKEVRVYDRFLTDDDVLGLHDALAKQYGITL